MRTARASLAAVLALAAAPAAAQDVGSLYRAGDEAYWAVEQRGAPLGHCWSRYEGEVALGPLRAHRFTEQVELELALATGEVTQRLTVELLVDDAGLPLRFDLRAQLADVKSAASGVVADGKAQLVVRQGPSERSLALDVPAGSFLLANNFVSHLELLLALDPPPEEGASHALFSASTLQPFTLSVRRTGTTDAGDAVLEDSLGERLTLTSEGELALVEIPSQGIVFRREDVPEGAERFTIELAARPADPRIERADVRIDDGAVSLAGSVTRPAGAEGRLPALLFLSGSGGQDRDGFSMGLDLGTHEILDHLTRAGFLVLRVDDRGVGGSTGPTDGLAFEDLVGDGRRALRCLLARDDVDAARVALIGHSEGALSAPLLAASEPVAAVVLMAAPGRPLGELLREQLLLGRELAGATAEARAAFGLEVDAFLARVAQGEPVEAAGLAPELAAFLPGRAWLASHLGRDPLAPLAALRCPVLALQGGRDVQVSAERDAPRVRAALERSGNPDARLVVLPELDHLFKRADERPSELDYLRARPVDAQFLSELTEWLVQRLAK